MTKVKITCGGYGRTVPGHRTVKTAYLGEVIEVEDAEAMRLEKIGAARILRSEPIPETPAKSPTEAPQTGVATPPVDPSAPEVGDNIPESKSAPEGQETPSSADVPVPTTPLPDTGSGKADVPDGDEDDAMDLPDGVVIVDGHMTVDSLLKMTKNDLLALAADMDLKANDRMTKDAIAIMISEVEVSVDGEAGLPELSQEDPTV